MLKITGGIPDQIDASVRVLQSIQRKVCRVDSHATKVQTLCLLQWMLSNDMNGHFAAVPFLWPQLAGVLCTVMHDDHSERRVPSSQLPQPLPHHSRRTDNDAGLEQATAVQACQEGCQLDGFPQAHLIPNDASSSLCVQLPQPFHAWRESNNPYGSAWSACKLHF